MKAACNSLTVSAEGKLLSNFREGEGFTVLGCLAHPRMSVGMVIIETCDVDKTLGLQTKTKENALHKIHQS